MTATPAEAKQDDVRMLACSNCGRLQTLDPLVCRDCGSGALAWVEVPARGRLYAATRIHRAPTPSFRSLVPYTLALVDMDGGGRMMGHCTSDVAIGEVVHATIFRHEGVPLLRFVPEGESQS